MDNSVKKFLEDVTRRQLTIFGAIFVAVVFVVVFFIIISFGRENDTSGKLPLYYFSPSASVLVPVWNEMPVGDALDIAEFAISQLRNDISNQNLVSVWPQIPNDEILTPDILLNLVLYDETLIAVFSDEYKNMTPLEEAIFRGAFTLTMTTIPGVERVNFRVLETNEDGEVVWSDRYESAGTIANNPTISPTRNSDETISLFFVGETGETLVEETYILKDVNVRRRQIEILEKLISGPSDDSINYATLIPPETRVRDITRLNDENIYYIDLSSEFFNNFSGTPSQARMMIASIVNTIIVNSDSNTNTQRVAFLIDSERREDFHGVGDFHLWFHFDETLFEWYEEPEETVDFIHEEFGE